MIVDVDGHEWDVVLADDVEGDVMDMEFRADPKQRQPTVVVAQHGDPDRQDLRISTYADVRVDRLLSVVRYAREQHSASPVSAADAHPYTFSSSTDAQRSPGIQFHSPDRVLLLTAWVDTASPGTQWAHLSQEIDLATFDAVIAAAVGELRSVAEHGTQPPRG
jgi:hypothetical protein